MTIDERWVERYRSARLALPRYALAEPLRCVLLDSATGKPEVVAWDQRTGSHRQVSDQTQGTSRYAIDPTGEWVWWFADPKAVGIGRWVRQPFAGGPIQPMTERTARWAGLSFAATTFAIGSRLDGRTEILVGRPDEAGVTLHSDTDQYVVGLSSDGELLALSEEGGSLGTGLAVTAVRDGAHGTVLATLPSTEDRRVHPIGFAPGGVDPLLLALHEGGERTGVLLWHPNTNQVDELAVPLAGDLRAEWLPDGSGLLLCELRAARSRLFRYHLATGELTDVPTPTGLVRDATARPDSSVEYLWSSSASPPQVRSTTRGIVLGPASAPPSTEVTDAWVTGDGGQVHALVTEPATGSRPFRTIFVLHGGPAAHDTDSFNPYVAAWADHGYCVVRVNYRGSTGYGTSWRHPADARVGLTELADVEAVRKWTTSSGLADPAQLVLAGSSWGGFLALLGIGQYPGVWAVAVAEAPIADFALAYRTETERLRALDRSLFGGSPEQVPQRYEESSPISYVKRVRAPVLLMAGLDDPSCPIEQVHRYAAELVAAGGCVELAEYPSAHGSRQVAERVGKVRRQIAFVTRELAGRSVASIGTVGGTTS